MKDVLPIINKFMPPPAEPVGREDWTGLERELGTSLPSDYKAFVDTYGSGTVNGFLWMYAPSVPDLLSFRAAADLTLENLRQYYRDGTVKGPKPLPPLYPETGGLLPFGGTENNNYLLWRTEGPPDQWSVVVWDPDYLVLRPMSNVSFGEFMLGVVDGTSPMFDPDDGVFPQETLEKPEFVPQSQ